jgi:tetratricopeptide (TPR) repeat protein
MFGFRKERIDYKDLPEEVQQTYEMLGIPGQDPHQCIIKLRRIVRNYPGFVPARLNLAALLLSTGNITEAKTTYTKLAKRYPQEQGAIAGLATVLAAEGNYTEAERLAEQALKNGYRWSHCYGVIAEARKEIGDADGAAEAYLAGYQLSPHSWNYLQEYCRLKGKEYTPPTEKLELCISAKQLDSLITYIDQAAHTPIAFGQIPDCDHTFRITDEWAEKNGIEKILLYQSLNAYNAYCDCEVCFNVEQ